VKESEISAALLDPGSLWREIEVVARTNSTNTDLLSRARSGDPEGTVLVAEAQSAGRGRMSREWISPPGVGLYFSVLLRPVAVSPSLLGWLPLLTGVAVVSALHGAGITHLRLKWPNDILAGHGKLAGILAESSGGAVVAGVGMNVTQRRDELPSPAATSLALEAGPGAPGREPVLIAVLTELARWYQAWRDQPRPGDADACGLREEYTRLCGTLGREVTVSLPTGRVLAGKAAGIDAAGRLEVVTADGVTAVSAGDVVHVR
jgi:BirA family transcriptional regulator, biotin operon repressor / biotin---[acetyl-CoA-carboxylase] ligase